MREEAWESERDVNDGLGELSDHRQEGMKMKVGKNIWRVKMRREKRAP